MLTLPRENSRVDTPPRFPMASLLLLRVLFVLASLLGGAADLNVTTGKTCSTGMNIYQNVSFGSLSPVKEGVPSNSFEECCNVCISTSPECHGFTWYNKTVEGKANTCSIWPRQWTSFTFIGAESAW